MDNRSAWIKPILIELATHRLRNYVLIRVTQYIQCWEIPMVREEPRTLQELISLAGKVSLITGAASGIGRAIAERYAEAGSSLILVDVDREGLDSLSESLKEHQVEIHPFVVDLAEKKEIDRLWENISDNPPAILVNNAGIYPLRKLNEVDEEFLDNVFNINLKSVFWMCQNMINAREGKGGVIINISSIEAILPFKDGLYAYGPSKWGVLSLTRSLAKEYSRKGFRVNALLPGGIKTPGTKDVAKGILRLQLGLVKDGVEFMSRLPMRRLGMPDEVARIATVIASDLSSYVTGAAIPVDGGFLSA